MATLSTPKVCDRLAQGNALGTRSAQINKALKGRHNRALLRASCAALTGLENDDVHTGQTQGVALGWLVRRLWRQRGADFRNASRK